MTHASNGIGAMGQHEWVIGTDPDCDVRVTDVRFRGQHCRVTQQQDRWWVEPLGGTVRVADVQVLGRTEIRPDDRVELATANAGQSVALPWPTPDGAAGVWTVGRSTECDVVLDVPNVSGLHARLILGEHGSLVLEDLHSTNGLYLDANRTECARGLQVTCESVVFFGLTPVKVSSLLDHLAELPGLASGRRRSREEVVDGGSANTPWRPPPDLDSTRQPELRLDTRNPSRTKRSNATGVRPTSRLKSTRGWLTGRGRAPGPLLASMVTLPLLLIFLIAFPLYRTHPTAGTATDAPRSTGTTSPDAELPSLGDAKLIASAEAAVSDTNGDSTKRSGADSPTATESDVADSLYWVLIELPPTAPDAVREVNDLSISRYRLGTAVAVSHHRLLTAGSVLLAFEELQEQLGGTLEVMHLKSQQILPVRDHGVRDDLARRMEVADAAHQKFAELSEQGNGEADREPLREQAELVDLALQAVSAVDVGWLEVEATSAPFVEIGSDMSRRPRQMVDVWHAAFDSEDPFWDPSVRAEIVNRSVRLEAVAGALEGIDGPSRLRLPTPQPELNFFGAPIMSDGKLAGIISSTAIRGEETDEMQDSSDQTDIPLPIVSVEAVAPSVLTELP